MKTKNIFKALVLASVLVSACGKNEIADDFKGYTLPVTINVTRQGDEPATRATYNESTKKLEFSAGDQLFVKGNDYDAGDFAGTLDYDAVSGKFSGTVTTENDYTGTIDDLMASAYAFLLPDGYGSYGVVSIVGSGYETKIYHYLNKAFALTKAAAVEQFSVELATSYGISGFALAPRNAIVSFTISGLTADKEVAVSFDTNGTGVISGNVTTNATGVATFAVGVLSGCTLEDCTLTVDGNNIAMPTKTTEAGHIYNISRSAAPAGPTAYTLAESTVGMIVGSDGKAYAVEDKDNLPSGVTAVAMVAYKSATAGSSLAIALADEGYMDWSTAKSTCEGKAAIGGNSWKLPSKDDWDKMITAAGGYTALRDGFTSVGGSNLESWDAYWSSTESGSDAWYYYFDEGYWNEADKEYNAYVRACLAF